ncbi:glycosyltransferase involved in cell wall biosynthesis [Pontibacter aydingkolensis]|uniref:Glycosyltransferase n=1 Tax=Pontibacter aydingkolensis TaxID=1911536 RepID=A0ABS7CTP4_9BACT|nr:glycosyltransferase [Pontibacter aydingkolensis]MBW7467224.1 glycosyltransferase [Pontibacter aydingkolensis]
MSRKIVVFATNDHGGAGESAYRVTKAIRTLGDEACLVVKNKTKFDSFVIRVEEKGTENKEVERISVFENIYRRFNLKRDNKGKTKSIDTGEIILDENYYFFNLNESISLSSAESILKCLPFKPEIILLAWVSDFISTGTALELQKYTGAKVYFLMTDMAPITGGCHYAWDCKGYTLDCSNCPAILSKEHKYKANQNYLYKSKNILDGNFKVIAGSGWSQRQASESSLFTNQETIPILNGLIDFSVFNNSNRGIAKQVFGISPNSKVIFSGVTYTDEKRKGVAAFVESLKDLYNQLPVVIRTNTKVLIAGMNIQQNKLVQQIPFDIIPVDFIKDNRLLSLAYQAADVYVCSSLEDTGPMMVNEALACGTPVVGFEMGLIYNMVINNYNGFKAPLGDYKEMANGMNKILNLDINSFASFSSNAIKSVQEHASLVTLEKVLKQIDMIS